MEVTSMIEIDLNDYGTEGKVILAPPSLRKLTMTKNMLAKCTKSRSVNGQIVMDEALVGDSEIVQVLQYVRTSPFPQTVEGVLSFTDKLDDIEYGNGERFWNDVIRGAEAIEKGEVSPFVDSQVQETPSSE